MEKLEKERIYKFLIKCNNYIEKSSYSQYYNPNIIGLIRKALSRLRVLTSKDIQINNVITLIHRKFERERDRVTNIFENLSPADMVDINKYSHLFGSELEIKEGNAMDIWHDMEMLCMEIPRIDGEEEIYFNTSIMDSKYSLYEKILDRCETYYGFNKDSGIPDRIIWMICDDMDIDREDISFEEIEEMFDVNIG